MAIEALKVDIEAEEHPGTLPDDNAVTELLFETLKLYEQGKLEAAFDKCKAALRENPESPSGHSLLCLIYEKKADEQIEKGNRDDAIDYLHAAIRQMERVLEENPDSAADQDKLDELKVKLVVLNETFDKKPRPTLPFSFKDVKHTQLPWIAGAVVFVLVFGVWAIVTGFSRPSEPVKERLQAPQSQTQPTPLPQQQDSQMPPAVSGPSSPVWSYQPPQSNSAMPAYPQVPQVPAQSQQPPSSAVTDRTLPPLTPYPVETPRQPEKPKQDEQASVLPAPEQKPAESASSAFMKGDYETAAKLYEQAISSGQNTGEMHQKAGMCYYNLGRKDAALNHFNRAKQIYVDQKARGIDPEAAARAIDTCNLYIDVLSRG